jgi:hypothetical protein
MYFKKDTGIHAKAVQTPNNKIRIRFNSLRETLIHRPQTNVP